MAGSGKVVNLFFLCAQPLKKTKGEGKKPQEQVVRNCSTEMKNILNVLSKQLVLCLNNHVSFFIHHKP